MRIPNNDERDGKTASTSFNIRENKGNVDWLLKQSLNAFNIDSTRLKRGGDTVSTSLFNKIERVLNAFSRVLTLFSL